MSIVLSNIWLCRLNGHSNHDELFEIMFTVTVVLGAPKLPGKQDSIAGFSKLRTASISQVV